MQVLPYACTNENREAWRPLVRSKAAPLVRHAVSFSDAALRINRNIWHQWKPAIVFKPQQTPSIMSPFEVRCVAETVHVCLGDLTCCSDASSPLSEIT